MDAWLDLSSRLHDPRRALREIEQFSKTLRARPDERSDKVKAYIEGDDNGCHYYRFLHELVKAARPPVVVETGTRKGCSAIQMASANPAGTVVTVDLDPNSSKIISTLGAKNITPITGDSISLFSRVEAIAPRIDLLYLDSDHSFARVLSEYVAYGSIVRDGGLIVFDDIHINVDLRRFWPSVKYPKIDLNHLHVGCGFGIAVKIPGISPI